MCASLIERLLTSSRLDEDDARRVLAGASRLRHAMRDGATPRLLAGRHLALAGAADEVFESAATRLGARVSHIDADLVLGDSPQSEAFATRMLARLYDGLACPRLAVERALRLHRRSGVPVYVDLAAAARALRGRLPATDGGPEVARDADLLLLVQALLVETLA